MTFVDVIIIYLTCGSPFGAHYFLNNRKSVPPTHLASKAILAVLVWPVYAAALLSTVNRPAENTEDYSPETAEPDSGIEADVREMRDRMEQNLSCRPSALLLYEFREVFDRYTGLTMALSKPDRETSGELARISGHDNPQLAAACLNRRNRKRLSFHQTQARNDFLAFVSALWDAAARQRVVALAIELAEVLSDTEAVEDLRVLVHESRQTASEETVSDLERDLWKSHARKPLPAASRLESNLRTMTASMSSRSDD